MRKRFLKILIVILLAFAIWIFLAPFLAESLIVEKKLEKADVILILGGSSTYIERTQKAAELFNSGVSEKILVTNDGGKGGWNPTEQRNLPFAEMARNNLISMGIPAESVEVLVSEVSGTISEAKLLKMLADERKYRSILIVTSAYHTRRSLWTFENIFAGSEVEIGIESAKTGIQTPEPFVWWLSIEGWRSVAGEYVKIIYYWLFI